MIGGLEILDCLLTLHSGDAELRIGKPGRSHPFLPAASICQPLVLPIKAALPSPPRRRFFLSHPRGVSYDFSPPSPPMASASRLQRQPRYGLLLRSMALAMILSLSSSRRQLRFSPPHLLVVFGLNLRRLLTSIVEFGLNFRPQPSRRFGKL